MERIRVKEKTKRWKEASQYGRPYVSSQDIREKKGGKSLRKSTCFSLETLHPPSHLPLVFIRLLVRVLSIPVPAGTRVSSRQDIAYVTCNASNLINSNIQPPFSHFLMDSLEL